MARPFARRMNARISGAVMRSLRGASTQASSNAIRVPPSGRSVSV